MTNGSGALRLAWSAGPSGGTAAHGGTSAHAAAGPAAHTSTAAGDDAGGACASGDGVWR